MSHEAALELLGDRIQLPSLPDVVLRLNSMLADPKVGLKEMGKVIGSDPGITARVLRVANSSFYGLRTQVSSAEQAAAVLGAQTLRNLAMQVSVMKHFEHLRGQPDFDLDEVWRHALATARLSQTLAETCFHRTGLAPDDFYACGLLHDVGKVVLLESLSEEYLEVLRFARRTGLVLHQAEEQRLGCTHVDVGALLSNSWTLPDKVAEAIRFHHGPRDEIVAKPHVAVVAIADQLAYRVDSSTFATAAERLADLAQRILGVSRSDFQRVIDLAGSGTLV